MAAKLLLLALVACPVALQATEYRANPIRKVVGLLQAMQTKVSQEGEKEKELYDKFMCYCKTGGGDIAASIQTAESKVGELNPDIKAAEEQKAQTEDSLKQAQTDREAAKSAMAEASAIREKEAAAFAAEKAEAGTNGVALAKAIDALEKGMGGAFLQTGDAGVLRKAVAGKPDMLEDDRQRILSFLAGAQGHGYAPQSGEVVGILKTMAEEMAKGFVEATKSEETAIEEFDGLTGAKKKELGALRSSIESKLTKTGELGVSIVQMTNDLTDTEEALLQDQKFLSVLKTDCATKQKEWEERQGTRAAELVALGDTIKLLNDDDALDLFKKTLPSASSSFIQLQVSMREMRSRALAALRAGRRAGRPDRARLDLVMLALRGKKIGFAKVMKMIDGMVATLKEEQVDDDKKKEYCGRELDLADDKKKGLEGTVADEGAAIASAKEGIAAATEEIASLTTGIEKLDKTVAEATENRKEEHQEYSELMTSDSAAKELLGFARNRLNKFYNPKLYKPEPKTELAADDKIVESFSGASLVQVSAHTHGRKAAPPPPPETFGAYTKKSQESGGVIAMIDLLIKDLDKDMTEAETEEKDAQKYYEESMASAAEKRAKDLQSLSEKGATKADLEASLESHLDSQASAKKELMAALEYIHGLHLECDWLMKYFDVRKDARADEVDAMGKAKAVLSGSDYSLLQTRSGSLRMRVA